jgi:phage-related protein
MYNFHKKGNLMNIHDYQTDGGKNLIKDYLGSLPTDERRIGYSIRHNIILYGLQALEQLNTRQLQGKLWEIKFSQNRIMYVLKDDNNIYFLHACKKQKGKAEQFELNKAIKRAKEASLL